MLFRSGTVSVSTIENGSFTLTHNPDSGEGHIDTPDTTRGAMYKVSNSGFFGTERVSPGDMIISYSNSTTGDSVIGWDIINENLDLRQLSNNALNGKNVITSVNLTNDGTLSYTYNELAVTNNRGIKRTAGLKTQSSGTININTTATNNAIPVITDITLSQTGTTTTLTYGYTYIYSSLNHHSYNTGINKGEITLSASPEPIISGISISNDGVISYTYNMYKVESSPTTDTVTYLYSTEVNSYTHSVVSIYKDPSNDNRLTYSYVNLSTSTGLDSGSTTISNTNKLKVLNGITQRGDGKISYSYSEINISHSNTGVQNPNSNYVLTNVSLSSNGELSYTYNPLTVETTIKPVTNLDLKTVSTGITKKDILIPSSTNSGMPVITGIVLSQDNTKTTLSYTYTYLYANQSHHSSTGISSSNGVAVLTNVYLSNDGTLSYTYNNLSVNLSKNFANIGLTSYGSATAQNTLRPFSGNTGIPVLTGITISQENDETKVSYAYTYIYADQDHHSTFIPASGSNISLDSDGTNVITGIYLSSEGALSYQYQKLIPSYSLVAGKLSESHTFWGQPFDGTQNVSGDMNDIGYAYTSGNVKITKPAYNKEFNGVDINTNAGHGLKVGIGTGGINRGLLDEDTDSWIIYTNGTGTAVSTYTIIPHNTRVGSTTNPGVALDVTGEIRASTKLYVGTGGSSKNTYLYSNANNNICAYTNGKIPLVIEDNDIRRGASNTAATLGTSVYRWANSYSVLGNFSGQVTVNTAANTAPFVITSTTLNTNLNADLLDDEHSYNIRSYGYDEDDILFSTLPFIQEKKNLSSSLPITTSPSPSDAPYGYCFGPFTNYTAWYSKYIAVSPGDKLACDMWIYREESTDAPSKTFYIGLERYDRNMKPISGNNGCVYSGASNSVVERDGLWHKFTGKWTLPTTHTPYPASDPVSDGGGVYYVRLRILLNYNAAGTESWLGGIKLYRQNSNSSAPYLTESHTFRVSDNSATHQGATVSFNGTQDVELKLPSYITVSIDGSSTVSYQIKTKSLTSGASYFTFVDSNNSTLTNENLYTTSNIYGTAAGAFTATGLGTFNTLKISNTSAVKHIEFSGGGWNYLAAPTSGSIAFVTNGKATSSANTDMVIQDKLVAPGSSNYSTLGSSSLRWNGLYSYTGNFSGQISSSVASGTAPFVITSTTLNTNLNADLLDGLHANDLFSALSATIDGDELVVSATIGGTTRTSRVHIWGDLSGPEINDPTEEVTVNATIQQQN